MKQRIFPLIYLSIFCFLQNSFSQNKFDPIFSAFNGTVYQIPDLQLTKGYNDSIEYNYEYITDIVLYKLEIPERQDKIFMEGIYQRTKFGIIFESEMKIKKDGWYQFSLNSDDGSILWIDEKLILDNDGMHKMTMVKDTIELTEGIYPIKIWYYQAFPDRYGLEFKATFLKEKVNSKLLEKTVFPSHALNFENNIYGIDENGKTLLRDFFNKIKDKKIRKITITGHTDSNASDDYNQQLSWNRANTVANELKKLFKGKEIDFIIIGKGESEPIDTNETESGRANNRRVEVVIQ